MFLFAEIFFIFVLHYLTKTLNLQNKILSILLLLVYFTYIFRIIVPLAEYVINYDYIIGELCEQKDSEENLCLGKCHLAKEISKQTELPSEKSQMVKFDFLKIPHTLDKLITNNNNSKTKLNLDEISSEKELNAYFKPLIPPPKYI